MLLPFRFPGQSFSVLEQLQYCQFASTTVSNKYRQKGKKENNRQKEFQRKRIDKPTFRCVHLADASSKLKTHLYDQF